MEAIQWRVPQIVAICFLARAIFKVADGGEIILELHGAVNASSCDSHVVSHAVTASKLDPQVVGRFVALSFVRRGFIVFWSCDHQWQHKSAMWWVWHSVWLNAFKQHFPEHEAFRRKTFIFTCTSCFVTRYILHLSRTILLIKWHFRAFCNDLWLVLPTLYSPLVWKKYVYSVIHS